MLGIRLPAEAEEELARHARAVGRGKSVIAREWILERLERESIDAQMRHAAQILAQHDREEEYTESDLDD
jgi:predicted DNA-binding protein